MIAQLNLENSSKCFVIALEANNNNFGTTIPIDIVGGYMILINPNKSLAEIARTTAHELVHVKQMAKGQLKYEKKNYVWMGKKYPRTIKYLDMPWEQEAFAKQELIMRRAIEE